MEWWSKPRSVWGNGLILAGINIIGLGVIDFIVFGPLTAFAFFAGLGGFDLLFYGAMLSQVVIVILIVLGLVGSWIIIGIKNPTPYRAAGIAAVGSVPLLGLGLIVLTYATLVRFWCSPQVELCISEAAPFFLPAGVLVASGGICFAFVIVSSTVRRLLTKNGNSPLGNGQAS